jgi:hypothetical protein
VPYFLRSTCIEKCLDLLDSKCSLFESMARFHFDNGEATESAVTIIETPPSSHLGPVSNSSASSPGLFPSSSSRHHLAISRLDLSPSTKAVLENASPLINGKIAIASTLITDVNVTGQFNISNADSPKMLLGKKIETSPRKQKAITLENFVNMILHLVVPCEHLSDFVCLKNNNETLSNVTVNLKSNRYPLEAFLVNRMHAQDLQKIADHPLLDLSYNKKKVPWRNIWSSSVNWISSQEGLSHNEEPSANADFLLLLARTELSFPGTVKVILK